MQFRTEIDLSSPLVAIDYTDRLLTLGSCFADRMGERMAVSRLQVKVNPLGISYNPCSISRLLQMVIKEEVPQAQYAEHLQMWHSFDLHSQFNQASRGVFEEGIAETFQEVSQWLRGCSYLFVTFGTAWVYRHVERGDIANNNHRYPAQTFERGLLSVEEIVQTWTECLDMLRQHRPELQVLFTVSPVRHIREGLSGNGLSKSLLRVACHELCTRFSGVHYFPAYEIMVDDLRDYRFYGDDLIHPTAFAEQYIWEAFTSSCLSDDARAVLTRWESVQRDLLHRPRQPKSEAHRRFLQKVEEKLRSLADQLDVEDELERVRHELNG